MLVFVALDLVLSCGVIVVSPLVVGSRHLRNNLMSLLIPFPFWVAVKQKRGQG